MTLFCFSLMLLGIGALVALLAGKGAAANRLPAAMLCGASLLGLAVAISTLVSGRVETLHVAWGLPFGAFSLRLDALAALFLIPTFLLAAACSLYGQAALAKYAATRRLGAHWFFFHILVLAMALVFTAADGFLFLLSWEAMSLAPFFLVSFYSDREQVRAAAWTYLVASHLGAFFLLALFMLLVNAAGGSFAFQAFESLQLGGGQAAILFGLAVVGFGSKAGLAPFHIWLPEAHPAAPSHVSAFMSGALIKAGIYGLLRIGVMVAPAGIEPGLVLLGLGLATGVGGILFALAQRDLKRLLAYSSVENIGIVVVGLGIGLFASRAGAPAMATLAYAGALLHALNHALFKGLLFLGAGSVLHATGSTAIDRLGGLQQRMPWTGACFGLGAAAIIALPPFNGFAGEFLLYVALAVGHPHSDLAMVFTSALSIFGLASIGGLALLCFAKAYGLAFLGEPRRQEVLDAHDPGPAELATMLSLGLACVLSGLAAPWLFEAILPVASQLAGTTGVPLSLVADARRLLDAVVLAALVLAGVVAVLALARRALLRRRAVQQGVTWDCGYLKPAASMQYSGGSFVQPVTFLLQPALKPGFAAKELQEGPTGYFPAKARFEAPFPDWILESVFRPLFEATVWFCDHFKWLQHGHINLYILYILLALLTALFWALR